MDVQYQVVRSHTSWKVWLFLIGWPVVRTGGLFTTNSPWVESNQIFLAMGQFSRKLRARVELPYQSIKFKARNQSIKFKIMSYWKC